jgi:hypothetical protein
MQGSNSFFREEKEREINHHGSSLIPNEDFPKIIKVSPVDEKSQNGNGPHRRSAKSARREDLVARDEKVEVEARKEYYESSLEVGNATYLRVCNIFLGIGMPLAYVCFAVTYFIIGFSYIS